MHRYVGVLFALLAVHNLRVLAAGNIGCLFSDTLCEQEREWCFDDHAFGHCLPHYGHYREEDFHRYELGSDELRLLEQEMQRLFLLGYRWSHTYTQCVLQELLQAIRRVTEFDISSCNGDVDQDLEGALRAIEGEELVDPRDLAIVRFMPSATDPHSDYADEVYFPPIKDQLQDHSEDHDNQEEEDHQESPTSEPGEPGESGRDDNTADDSNGSPHPQGGGVDSLPANPPGPLPNTASAPASPHDRPPPLHDTRQQNHINYYGPDDDDMDDDYDDSNTYRSPYHYQTPLNPVYRKRARMEEDVPFMRGDKLTISQLRKIASLLDNLSEQKLMMNEADERVLFSERMMNEDQEDDDDDDDLDDGVFKEVPTRPMYTEAGRQFIPEVDDDSNLMESPAREAIWSNMPQDMNIAPEGLRNMADEFRNMPGFLDTLSGSDRNFQNALRNPNMGMRNLPGSFQNMPAPYAQYLPPPEYQQEPLASENSISRLLMRDDPNPFEMGLDEDLPLEGLMLEEEMQNALPRNNNKMSAIEKAFGPQLSNLRDYEDEEEEEEVGGYGDYPDYELLDEYAGDYDEMVRTAGWNFERAGRLDVKKPGPGFRVNDYAFNPDPKNLKEDVRVAAGEEDLYLNEPRDAVGGGDLYLGDDEMEDQGASERGALLMSRLMGGSRKSPFEVMRLDPVDSPMEQQQLPDLLLADEGVVDEATDQVVSLPKAEKLQSTVTRVGKTHHSNPEGKEGSKKREEEADTTTVVPTEEVEVKDFEGPHSYVYITTSGRIMTYEEGVNLARSIVKLAGLPSDQITDFEVIADQVSFQVKDNAKGITAKDIADTAKELHGQVEAETGIAISQSGLGTKTALSAVVFNSSEKHILAAAAIVCGVMAALLVAASVLFFLRRHAKSKAKLQGLTAHDTEASKDYQDLCRARMAGKAGEGGKVEPSQTHVPSQRVSSLSKDSDNGNNSPSSRSSTSSCEEPVASNMDISTGHMVLSYMEDHLKNKDRLEQEWIALCAYEAEPCATTLAMKPENSKKNRYPDSVPYDHNRVILNAHTNVNGSDYINASSITDHDPRNPAYIATQGPLNTTAADFWQLVWEQGSVVIVMLTRLTENGHAFCHRYWPEEGSDLYHIYEVHLVSEHIWCDDYLVRSFYLKNVKTGETRTVTQFHFLSWPDSGTPASTKALLEFRRKVNKSYRGRSCPIIVHCSDGIGRTGTYSLIDMVLNRMAKGAKEIDIAATLEHIRDQRPQMVKSKSQFEFVLMAVAEEVHAILKALPQ